MGGPGRPSTVSLPTLVATLIAIAAPPAHAAPPAQAPAVSAQAYAAYLRGRLAEQQSDWRSALEAYRSAAEADPRAPVLRVALAEARARTGDLRGAEAECRTAIELAPRAPTAADAWVI